MKLLKTIINLILSAPENLKEEAEAYYCGKCKRGFKTRGAKINHCRIKHKV